MQTDDRAFLKRQGTFVFVFAGLASITTAHFVHYGWEVTEFFRGMTATGGGPAQLYAPAAYRIFMPTLDRWLDQLFPGMDLATVNACTDAVFLWATLWVIYKVAVQGWGSSAAGRASRSLRIALTLLLSVTALAWMTQYQRPETAPTALYLAGSALLLRKRGWWPALLQLAWTALQGFTRADVGLCLGVGMMTASLLHRRGTASRSSRMVLQGLATAAIAATVQLYLQFIRFPHLSYDPQTSVFQGRHNLHPHMWANALVAIFPVWLPLLYALLKRLPLLRDEVDAISLVAGAVYLPLWFTVGSLAEVRIYIPFLILMSPIAASAIANALGVQDAWPTLEPESPLYE